MELWRIDEAVKGLCHDVESLVHNKSHTEMTEDELAYELAICILGSGVRYEVCISYASVLKQGNYLSREFILCKDARGLLEDVLSSPVNSVTGDSIYNKYRYPVRGADHILRAFSNIYTKYSCFKDLIESHNESDVLRRQLINICPGIGPKQASHYLKNVGHTCNVAILDRHIIKYMEMSSGVHISSYNVSKIDRYEEIENKFIELTRNFGFSASVVDQSLWFIMRALGGRVLA